MGAGGPQTKHVSNPDSVIKMFKPHWGHGCLSGITPILAAAGHDARDDIVDVLIAANANVNDQTHDGCTPLYVAASSGNDDTVLALVAAGADINIPYHGHTPLQAATHFEHAKVVDILRNAHT